LKNDFLISKRCAFIEKGLHLTIIFKCFIMLIDCIFMILDLHGYIASLNSTQSSSGNEFFDVKLKTSTTSVQLIKIMKRTNSSVSLQYLNEMRSAGTPLMFTKLSPGSNGIFFFNTYKGSAIQNSSEVTFMFNPTEKMTLSEIKKQLTGTF